MRNTPFSFRARLRSFRYAFAGIFVLLRQEHNARIHVFIAVCTVVAGILLDISAVEWMVIVLAIGTVLAAEGMNSAIECLADRVSSGQAELIGRAKDLAAGAVLLVAISAATAGMIIFIPRILNLF